MKENNPPKKLKLLKKTIAHLTYDQMDDARGGNPLTRIACIVPNSLETFDCPTLIC